MVIGTQLASRYRIEGFLGRGGMGSIWMLVGTLTRMSPEQLQGECVDFHTDIWAFALLVFEVLVGKPVVPPDSSMGETVLRICGADLPVPSRENFL